MCFGMHVLKKTKLIKSVATATKPLGIRPPKNEGLCRTLRLRGGQNERRIWQRDFVLVRFRNYTANGMLSQKKVTNIHTLEVRHNTI